MDKENRELRQEVFDHYARIADERRLSLKDVGNLAGLYRNTLAANSFLNDRVLYLRTFIKLCIGLDVLPSDLLDMPKPGKKHVESTEDILRRLNDRQLRAVLMHALSYMEETAV